MAGPAHRSFNIPFHLLFTRRISFTSSSSGREALDAPQLIHPRRVVVTHVNKDRLDPRTSNEAYRVNMKSLVLSNTGGIKNGHHHVL
ncbi:hypothetical protein FNV43_RR21378 [Rhamnella rubrinervis]|uniref:Uncharacterized protein n=1 Tax=Rhamnella rubrinervis TaxID=2594499 RepID=A0A8K0E379_9ROSA|nr:hypothetical protein FNV43_RR21378 [Rhamnella rubrinervis]